MLRDPRPWTPQEKVLLVYLASREIDYPIIRRIIRLKLGRDRRAMSLEMEMDHHLRLVNSGSWPLFYHPGSETYDLELVDQWLCTTLPKSEVERLIRLDKRIIDAVAYVSLAVCSCQIYSFAYR